MLRVSVLTAETMADLPARETPRARFERNPSAGARVEHDPSARSRVEHDAAGRARLEQMFRAHHELVWRTLRRMGLSPEAAADATQQAFLIAAERLSDIRAGSERAFLFGTALRLAKTAFRTMRRFQLEDDMDTRPDPALRDEHLTDLTRAREIADRVLSRLEPDLLSVFVLFELEGMSSPEIAKLIDIPVGTVASRLRRARESFRSEVKALEASIQRGAKP
jgi:RNA polymerase sigma-70 factor (ECF subfamily)